MGVAHAVGFPRYVAALMAGKVIPQYPAVPVESKYYFPRKTRSGEASRAIFVEIPAGSNQAADYNSISRSHSAVYDI